MKQSNQWETTCFLACAKEMRESQLRLHITGCGDCWEWYTQCSEDCPPMCDCWFCQSRINQEGDWNE